MRVEARWGREALAELRGEWAGLWERCPELTPFQHPNWLIPWSRHFGGSEFLVVTLRRGEELVGLAPFFVAADRAGRRDLLLLGTGNTDYLDLLVEPEIGEEGAALMLLGALEAAGCDRCELRQLRAGSALLGSVAGEGWEGEVLEDEPCPVLALPTGVEQLGEVVRPSYLARVRRDRRRLERRGEVVVEPATERSLMEIFDTLVELHQRRWAGAGEPGIFADQSVLAFHLEVVQNFLREGWLRLYALRSEGRIIAGHYGFACRDRVYNYIGGHDPEYAHWSPGALAVAHSIEAAVGEAAACFDFLRGREAYKYDWGARDTFTFWRRLWRRGLENRK